MDSNYLLDYLLKIVTIHGIFFVLYFVLLRNKTSHKLNRTYLLSTLIVAFFIPALEFSIPEESVPLLPEVTTFQWEDESVETAPVPIITEEASSQRSYTLDYWGLAKWAYIVLSLGLILRSVFHLIILQKLKNQSEYVEKQWFKLFRTAQTHPFSFLSNVFIPKAIFGTNSFDQILEHECEHVRQHHSLDRLLLDFMVALFWFNPFIFLYRKALIEIHEYQADAAVLEKFPDAIEYQEVLFSQLSTASYSGLVSHFNFSTIKKRIVMINKRNTKRSVWAYALAVPVTLWVIMAFSGRVDTDPIGATASGETSEETTAEQRQDTATPSISPIKEKDGVRLSSGFGIRMHPIYRVEKMHQGIDLATAEGTEVVATGDGKIIKTQTKFGGYGRMITIAHGDKYETRYAQLSSIDVKVGDVVKKGQRIGLSGNSGASTAPHLHYEVMGTEGKHLNPLKFIHDRKFTESEKLPVIMEVQPTKSQEDVEEEPDVIEIVEIPTEPEDEVEEKAQLIEVSEVPMEEVGEGPQIYEVAEVPMEAEEVVPEVEEVEKEVEAPEVAVSISEDDGNQLDIEFEGEQLPLNRIVAVREGKLKVTPDQPGKQPLFVLDGSIVEEISNLDPKDIESIVVLKDKSAWRLYGAEGINGVVMIETKGKRKTKTKTKEKSDKKLLEKDKKKNKGIGLTEPYSTLEESSREMKGPEDAPSVVAAVAGEVTAISFLRNVGNVVIVKHEDDYYTVYGKLETVEVSKGDHVRKGQKIGLSKNYPEISDYDFSVYQGRVRLSAEEMLAFLDQ